MNKILGKVNSSANKILFALMFAVLAVQSAFAQGGALEIPAATKDEITGYVTSGFPTVIAIVGLLVAAGVLIKLFRKAG